MEKFTALKIQDLLASGTTDGVPAGANDLIDSGASFTTDGIVEGDIVMNVTTRVSGLVEAVVDDNNITLQGGFTIPNGDDYAIYSASSFSTTNISLSDIDLIEQAAINAVTITYNTSDSSVDLLTITHENVALGDETVRDAWQETVLKAYEASWTDVLIELERQQWTQGSQKKYLTVVLN